MRARGDVSSGDE